MNKNDSEHIAGMFESQGYKATEEIERANVLVLNTCAVRDKAERRVYGQLSNYDYLRRQKKLDMKIFLSGCMPAYKEAVLKKEIPFLDGFIDLNEARTYPAKRFSNEAWVTIMYGCDNFCSYCIVPYVRGREKSRPVEEIIEEIKKLDLKKYTYICLLGQNVNSYQGVDAAGKKYRFPQLLQKIIDEVPKIKKIGFLTSHPKDMSNDLIDVIAKNPKVDRDIHLPVQHANNRLLKLMNRKYTYGKYKALVKRIRKKIPNVQLSTDLIVGFPEETEKEFNALLDCVKELRFFRVNTAAYSIRTGTAAAKMPGQLPEKLKNERLNKLNRYVKKYALINQKSRC